MGSQPFGDKGRLLEVNIVQHDEKLLSANAGEGVALAGLFS